MKDFDLDVIDDKNFIQVLKNNWIFLTISVTTLILCYVSWCIESLNNGICALCAMGLCFITDVWDWIGRIWFLALIFFIIWSFIKRYHSFWKTITKHKWLKMYFFTSTIVVFLGILVLLVNNSTVVGYSWDDQGGAIVGTPVYKGL